MDDGEKFMPSENPDDGITPKYQAFVQGLDENFKEDFPITMTVEMDDWEGEVECVVFADMGEIVENFEKIAEKYPELQSSIINLKEENPRYREQWMKCSVFERFIKYVYIPKKFDEFQWSMSDTIGIPRITLIHMTLDQESLNDSIRLLLDPFEMSNGDRLHDFARIFSSPDNNGELFKYKEIFVKALINFKPDAQAYIWNEILNAVKITEDSTGRKVVLPEKFEDAYNLFTR